AASAGVRLVSGDGGVDARLLTEAGPFVPLPAPAVDQLPHGLPQVAVEPPTLPAATPAGSIPAVPLAASPPAITARSPWTAAADAGAAIGRGSRNAGVATGGFFTRL